MNETGVVTELWRYPASSLGGERVQTISADTDSIDGDRMFGLVDVSSDEIARPAGDGKWHPVPRIKTRLSPAGELEIATPASGWLKAPGSESDRAVSAYLGFDAAIRPFRRENASPGYSGPLTSERYRKAPIHLLTTASLARLKALHPTGAADPRRFRPNIVVDMAAVEGSFPETEWIGRKLAVGDLVLTISEPCRRCGFTIIAQDGFDHDPEVLRSLVRHNARNLGVYCTVDQPGRVEVGAAMRFL